MIKRNANLSVVLFVVSHSIATVLRFFFFLLEICTVSTPTWGAMLICVITWCYYHRWFGFHVASSLPHSLRSVFCLSSNSSPDWVNCVLNLSLSKRNNKIAALLPRSVLLSSFIKLVNVRRCCGGRQRVPIHFSPRDIGLDATESGHFAPRTNSPGQIAPTF